MQHILLSILFLTFSSVSAESFEEVLEKVRLKYDLPALAAAVTYKGKEVVKGAVGTRKYGTEIKVTIDDKFHIGSCTKSMTATLAGILVDQGKIKWTTTLEESFPGLKIHEGYKKSTLEQLLSHTAGFPNTSNDAQLWVKLIENKKLSPVKQRQFLLETLVKRKPAYERGSQFIYSNCSVTFAGMMLEVASGKTWETLMKELLVKPLKMNSLGFGPQATFGKIDQPLGHYFNGEKAIPVPSSIHADNPPAIAPAGLVHLSVADFAKYSSFYSLKGKSLLKPETFAKITNPVKKNFGLGWVILQRPWGGKVLFHDGSNTSNLAIMWIAPEKEFSVVVVTNIFK